MSMQLNYKIILVNILNKISTCKYSIHIFVPFFNTILNFLVILIECKKETTKIKLNENEGSKTTLAESITSL